MEFEDRLRRNRSIRRFHQDRPIPVETLRRWVGNVCLAPSAANLQPLRFVIVGGPEMAAALFVHLRWAAYLKEWPGPAEGERPSAYLVMLGDRRASPYLEVDSGIALQTILLSAVAEGFNGCAIANCNKKEIARLMGTPETLEILMIIALGRSAETVVLDEVKDNNVRYWRDQAGVHHVPKRRQEDLVLKVFP